jgi:hypothetical protein
MQALLTLPPSPIGLRAFVLSFESKAKNPATIVIIGAGCASTMRARPATQPQRADNPRERLRAIGPAVCPADDPAATTAARRHR